MKYAFNSVLIWFKNYILLCSEIIFHEGLLKIIYSYCIPIVFAIVLLLQLQLLLPLLASAIAGFVTQIQCLTQLTQFFAQN